MQSLQKKRFSKPDKTISRPKSKFDTIEMGDISLVRTTYKPGWQWSKDIKPVAKTEWCEKHHFLYCLEGRMRIRMRDGSELELGPGDVVDIPPGHDGMVIGKKPAIVLDLA
jgi:mannose-6-phosphate isomerase-like protein (cupin superfamily)